MANKNINSPTYTLGEQTEVWQNMRIVLFLFTSEFLFHYFKSDIQMKRAVYPLSFCVYPTKPCYCHYHHCCYDFNYIILVLVGENSVCNEVKKKLQIYL